MMKSFVVGCMAVVAVAGAGLPVGVSAQTAPPAAPSSVDDYLCTFAGKCRADAADGASRAAPDTKGFRLAAPSSGAAHPAAAPASPHAVAPAQTAASTRARALAPVRAPAKVRPPAGTNADLRLSFAYKSDRLTGDAEARARVFAAALQTPELKAKRFMIAGHTDSRGSRSGNLALSKRRARAVADYLIAQGVAADRLEVNGYGSARPLPHMPAAAEANRRVEAVLLS